MVTRKIGAAGHVQPEEQGLIIERIFDAPRELVFHAWTDPERGMCRQGWNESPDKLEGSLTKVQAGPKP